MIGLESVAVILIAVIGGASALNSRIYKRIDSVDTRVDSIELSVAKHYVSKAELDARFDRLEAHMIRLEGKLDMIDRH